MEGQRGGDVGHQQVEAEAAQRGGVFGCRPPGLAGSFLQGPTPPLVGKAEQQQTGAGRPWWERQRWAGSGYSASPPNYSRFRAQPGTEENPFAEYVRILVRGKSKSRALGRAGDRAAALAEARALWAARDKGKIGAAA